MFIVRKFLLIDWLSQTFYFNNLNTWQNNFLKSEKLTLILEISLVAIFIRARNEEESCWKGEHVLEKKSLSWWLGKKKTWWEEREYNKRPRSSVRDICPLARLQPLMFIEPHITAYSSECYVFKYVHLHETFCIQILTGAFEDLCPWLYETAALVLKRFQGFVLCAIDNTFTEHSTA